ncbi:MAG TPA: hypothetical protein DIU35_10755 [Candidatus Latescibacteria bacterium]|nr:hypothetical protein [Gemmatimonadota bacterium]HCR17951.1 hypothetical protein [Candidatus Latescibacterota bacterium]
MGSTQRWLLAGVYFLLFSCAAERKPGELLGPSEEGVLVVDALLLVDQPLPDLYIRKTIGPSKPWTAEFVQVTGAQVEIRQGDRVFFYQNATGTGRYVPAGIPPIVEPNTTYELKATLDNKQVRGITITPSRFRIERAVLVDEETLVVIREMKTFDDGEDAVFNSLENQVNYLSGLLEARFQAIDVPAYQVGIQSLDLDSERVIGADFLDEEDYADLERQESSPPLEAEDGILRLPWFAIYFGGRHMIRIYALDKNWFDFTRSSPLENEGGFVGSLAGDNFERPIFNLEGGIGLFGSASVDSVGFFVLPRL